MEKRIGIPEITKEFETFDIEKFNAEKNDRGEIIINEDNKYIILLDYANGYSKGIYDNSSSFYTVKNFHLNGNIEIKGARFNNGSEYGIFYEFNEAGELIAEINTDEGYDFSWVEVIKYCRKNDIELDKGYVRPGSGVRTTIYKIEEDDGRKVWEIQYYKQKTLQYIEVILDGKTGEVIKNEEFEFIEN